MNASLYVCAWVYVLINICYSMTVVDAWMSSPGWDYPRIQPWTTWPHIWSLNAAKTSWSSPLLLCATECFNTPRGISAFSISFNHIYRKSTIRHRDSWESEIVRDAVSNNACEKWVIFTCHINISAMSLFISVRPLCWPIRSVQVEQ